MQEDLSKYDTFGVAVGNLHSAQDPNLEYWLKEQVGREAADVVAQEISVSSEQVAILDKLEVDPAARGEGRGRALLKEFIEEALDRGADGVILVADTYGPQSTDIDLIRFYESNGFVEVADSHSGPLMAYPAEFARSLQDAVFNCSPSLRAFA